MKSILRITVLLVVALVANYSMLSAAILRVNNNTGVTGTGVYATLPLAYAAAAAGDTLIIEGSNTSYADQIITKKLTIFGPGYLLAENPETQASSLTVTLGDITFNTGSDGSTISGCKINKVEIGDNNITVSRNFIQNATAANPSILLNQSNTGIKIKQNIIWGKITNTAAKTISVVIQNNLIGAVDFTNTVTAFIDHNTFQNGAISGMSCINVSNSNIFNNIVSSYPGSYYTAAYGSIVFDVTQNNTIRFNVLEQAAPATSAGTWSDNTFAIAWSTVFASGTGAIDKNYNVTAGSAADDKDQTLTSDCGMFGGSSPYVLSGLPPIPHIYMLNADPAGTNTDPLSVKISVKSQN